MERISADVYIYIYMSCKLSNWANNLSLYYLESAEDGGHPLLQVIPSSVPIMHHFPESEGGVGAVLPGQTAVLFVDELQLGQALLHLTLEGLQQKHTQIKTLNRTQLFTNIHALL